MAFMSHPGACGPGLPLRGALCGEAHSVSGHGKLLGMPGAGLGAMHKSRLFPVREGGRTGVYPERVVS